MTIQDSDTARTTRSGGLALARIRAHGFRYPLTRPVRTSFGVMTDRPAIFVEVEDVDGARGWGEIWCNFPGCGAEHRMRLLDTVIAPLLVDRRFATPAAAFLELSARTAVLALQSGEPGPIAQTIAGVEIALCDLAARKAGRPLWRWLRETGLVPSGAMAPGPDPGMRGDPDDPAAADRALAPMLTPYASGINPDGAGDTAARCLAEGYRAFKLKVGFGEARDLTNLAAIRAVIGSELPLLTDANQAWDLPTASAMAPQLAEFHVGWLEEPLRADRPWREWRELARISPVPLAAGENVAGDERFDEAIASGALRVLQPDLAKWGGFSGNAPVIGRALAAGLRYCPHFLGGGLGLLASAHLQTAFGGGLLEVDSNDNPLRSLLAGPLAPLQDGRVRLGEAAGLGVVPDFAALSDWRMP